MDQKPIPFKKMTPERAAKFLDCSVNDIFQWAEEHAIRLCIDCENIKAEVCFTNDDKYSIPPETDNTPIWNDGFSSFLPARVTFDENSELFVAEGMLNGLFILDKNIFSSLKRFEDITMDFIVHPFKDDGSFPITIKIKEYSKNNSDDSFFKYLPKIHFDMIKIHSEDIEVIRNILYPAPTITPEPEEPSNTRAVSRKTVNAMALFIKQLIAINYGEDVAESPRKYFENKESKINRDFDSQGMKPPTGVSVAGWLKDTDLN